MIKKIFLILSFYIFILGCHNLTPEQIYKQEIELAEKCEITVQGNVEKVKHYENAIQAKPDDKIKIKIAIALVAAGSSTEETRSNYIKAVQMVDEVIKTTNDSEIRKNAVDIKKALLYAQSVVIPAKK
jgi:hypothetical protein